MMEKVWLWLGRAFSDEHGPSSSRIISAWLSVSSMALIWWTFRHMQSLPVEKLAVWMGNMPMVIGALATFSVAPYTVGKFAGIFKKDDREVDNPDKK